MNGEDGSDEAPRPARRRPKGRALSEEERKLWRAVVKDAKPLVSASLVSKPEPSPMAEAPRPGKVVPIVERNMPDRSETEMKAPVRMSIGAGAPPLTGLDRRTSQRLARGQLEAEARLDLHGLRQDEAEDALFRFLARSRAAGLRLVLVITGKGESPFTRHTLHGRHYHEAPERSGVLRAALPVWLASPRFRAEAAGFQPAHPKHGGGGAFYIRLRKKP